MKYYGTVENYKNLAFGVLERAVQDYYVSKSQGTINDNAIYDIDPIWFELTGIDSDWFFTTVIKEGERRYGRKVSKRSKVY